MDIDLKALVDALKMELGVNQRETVTLTKNTKGYNWDLKIFWGESDDQTIERLVTLKEKMEAKFPKVDSE